MLDVGASTRRSLLIALASLASATAGAEELVTDPADHLRALGEIAAANGGNRAAGTPGYERSVEYVSDQLRQAGYQVRIEEFTYPFSEERSPPRLVFGAIPAPDGEVRSFIYSGAADVTAPIRPVDLALPAGGPVQPSTSACEPADFAGFERGSIALVRRGACAFFVKVQNAIAAGAVGVIAMNEGTPGQTASFSATLGRPSAIPVVAVGYAYGRTLAERAGKPDEAMAHLVVDVVTSARSSKNVIAEMPAGERDHSPVVVVGGHLDSVRDGPGLNDNGSGVTAILLAATRLAPEARNGPLRVRFAFWGAEEIGLIGSREHVNRLSDEERKRIALYINLDMVGSLNFARFILADPDADGAAGLAARAVLDHFARRSLPAERRGAGRLGTFSTDIASFTARGIRSIGLYTGSAELKRDEQAAVFGGTAGQPYDSCYHRACDAIANVDPSVVGEMSEALSDAIRAVTAPQ